MHLHFLWIGLSFTLVTFNILIPPLILNKRSFGSMRSSCVCVFWDRECKLRVRMMTKICFLRDFERHVVLYVIISLGIILMIILLIGLIHVLLVWIFINLTFLRPRHF